MNEPKTSHVISFGTILSALRAEQLGSYTAVHQDVRRKFVDFAYGLSYC